VTLRICLSSQPEGSVSFSVWAPHASTLSVLLPDRAVPLQRTDEGLYTGIVSDLAVGATYSYLLEGSRARPDPVSRCQPHGVHGPSAVVDPAAFRWNDHHWHGLPLKDLVLYELHVGTFTAEGSFRAIIPYLDYLKEELGVTAIELMPIAAFPGARNWGYDGVHSYAPQSSYGGPVELQSLVDACHEKGLAVALDVVYNHLGPEGNYLREYGPYFTSRYHTPWGDALNFDGEQSHQVRRYVIDNALYWITEYHIDILRLDAIHGIYDTSPTHLLQELTAAVHAQGHALGRTVLVIAESDLNDNRVITPREQGGWGLDAQWSDDFHHALHALVTGERAGYYQDFGRPGDLVTALTEGFVYQGQYAPYRGRPHGTPSRQLPSEQFVVCSQNHDQVGNRANGERLSALVPASALKLAAGLVLCAPTLPLLFMGEEYGERAPFLYFTSHTDPALAQAVSEGRRREFSHLVGSQAVPDPQAEETFLRSKLQHSLREQAPHRALLRFYRDVLALRKHVPALRAGGKDSMKVQTWADSRILLIHRTHPQGEAIVVLASLAATPLVATVMFPAGRWEKVMDADEARYGGTGDGLLPAVLETTVSQRIVLSPFQWALYVAS
jgi:maltooligosyltrehalose trehalohydrolase